MSDEQHRDDDRERQAARTGTAKGDQQATATGSPDARGDQGPESPAKLRKRSWIKALKMVPKEFMDDGMMDVAAALTYYAVLSIFPALIALVSILGLAGHSATDVVLDSVKTTTPDPARDVLIESVGNVTRASGVAPFLLGLGAALWSASGYVGAFGRASNVIYEVEEGRPFWKVRPMQLALTALLLALIAAGALAVLASGPIAKETGEAIGAGREATSLWDILKWPVILAAAALAVGVLMYFAPNVKVPGFSWVVIGGIVALLSWLVASGLLAIYFANFANYNKTYGALAGVIAFMFWLWVTNLAMLLGQELNAELERQREVEVGLIGDRDDALKPELRQQPKD